MSPAVLWDTMLAEKALMLGRSPWRRKSREALTDEEAASLKEAADAEQESSLSLYSVAASYGIAIPRRLRQGRPSVILLDQAHR